MIGGLFVAFGLVALVGSWGAHRYDTRITRAGVQATATVTARDLALVADGESDFDLDYAFVLPDGRPMSVSRTVPKAVWDTMAVGDQILVLYDPANPSRNFPVGAGNTSLGLTIVLSIFGAVFLVAGTALTLSRTRPPAA